MFLADKIILIIIHKQIFLKCWLFVIRRHTRPKTTISRFAVAVTVVYALSLIHIFSKDAVYVDSWVTDFPFRTNKNLADSKNYPFKITTKKHGRPNKYGHCLAPFKHICIAWNGEVMHCTDFYDFSAGNVKIDDISNIFDNKLSEKFRSEIVNGKCVLCNHCSWLNNDSFDV